MGGNLEIKRGGYPNLFKELENNYCDFIGVLPGIVYTLDTDGKFCFLSENIESTLGLKSEDIIGHHFSTIIHPEEVESVSRASIIPRFEGIPTGSDKSPKLFDERRAGARRTENLCVHLLIKHSSNPLEKKIFRCKVNSSGRYDSLDRFIGTIGVMFDISEENDSSFSLESKIPYNAFDLLTRAIAHVFSNVFTGIYGNLQLIEMQLDDPEKFRGNIEAIKQSVEKTVSLIHKLGRSISIHKHCDGNGLKKLLTKTAEEFLKENGIKYQFNIQSPYGIWHSETDIDYLSHIIRSLYFHIVSSVDNKDYVRISLSNLAESPVVLPRTDCNYILIKFEYKILSTSEKDDNISRFSSLERIASMALSYELLKKIGGLLKIEIDEAKTEACVFLYLPAIRNE